MRKIQETTCKDPVRKVQYQLAKATGKENKNRIQQGLTPSSKKQDPS